MSNFAVEPRVAAAHAELAERYKQLAEEFDINRPDAFGQLSWDLTILPLRRHPRPNVRFPPLPDKRAVPARRDRFGSVS